jgi:hypothetical protein
MRSVLAVLSAVTVLLRTFHAWRFSPAVLALIALAVSAGSDSPEYAFPLLFIGQVGSTGTLDWLLTDYYDDEWVRDGVNNLNPLKDICEEKSSAKEYGGKKVVYPFHTTRNPSPFFCAEYGYFAEGGVQGGVDIQVNVMKMMGRVGPLTDEIIKDSAVSEAAWEGVEDNNFNALVKDMARRQELALTGDGRGVLCRLNSDPGTATSANVDSPGGYTGSVFGNRFLTKDFYIGAVDPATGTLRAGIAKVLAPSADGASVSFTAAINAAWADNDYLVKVANPDVTNIVHTEYQKWPYGLLALFDDGTYLANYGGVDRTMVDNVNSFVQAAVGTLSVDGMQVMADAMDTRIGGKTSIMFAHNSIRRLVLKVTQADRRYADKDLQMNPDPGTKAFKQGDITVGEVPIKAIRDFPFGTLMGVDVENAKLRRYVSTSGEWVTNNNGKWFPVGLGREALDAKEAWYRMRYQYWAKEPAYAWRMDGITGATVTIVRPLGD